MSLDRVRRSCCWVMGLAWPALAAAATWDTRLSVPVSAGHSDNTRLVTDARKESDTFWRIAPGISLSAQAPRWRASVNYAYLLERHLRGDRDGDSQSLTAAMGAELARNLLFVDASAAIAQQRDNVLDNTGFDTTNLQDVYSWTARPALRRDFANRSRAELALAVRGVNATGRNQTGNGLGQRASVVYSTGGMLDAMRLDLSASDDRFEYADEMQNDSHRKHASLRATLTLSRRWLPFAEYGYEQIRDENLIRDPDDRFWRAGFNWNPSARMALQASAGERGLGQTRSLSIQHRLRRVNWSVSYVQEIRDGQQDYVDPESMALFEQLNTGLAQTVPDATERAAVANAFLQRQGLPPVTLLGNRHYLDRNWSVNLGYASVKSRTGMTFYWRDSSVAGLSRIGAVQGAEDHVRQQGATLDWRYQLGRRASVFLAPGYTREQYPSIGLATRSVQLRTGVAYSLGRHVTGTAELRRIDKSASDETREFTENSALLSLIASF